MPNGISSYNVYKGAGEAMGEFESSLGDVEGIWGDVDYSREMSSLKTQQRESNLDSLMAVTELGSTLYGGWKAKKEFKGDLTSAQQMAAKKIYGADYTPEQLSKVKPFEVGAEGEAWGDLSPLQKMFQEKQYRFGAGDDSYTMGKADITAAAGLWKYGTSPDISGFKTPSMAEEVGGVGSETLDVAREMGISEKEVKADVALSKTASGDVWAAPDWESIHTKQLSDIESATESYSKRKGQYDWLVERGIIKKTQREQLEGHGKEAAGDIVEGTDNYNLVGDFSGSDNALQGFPERGAGNLMGRTVGNIYDLSKGLFSNWREN